MIIKNKNRVEGGKLLEIFELIRKLNTSSKIELMNILALKPHYLEFEHLIQSVINELKEEK